MTHKLDWPDVAADDVAWRRGKKWGTAKLKFNRSDGFDVWVDEEAYALLAASRAMGLGARKFVIDELRKEFPRVGVKWRDSVAVSIMTALRTQLGTAGLGEDTVQGLTSTRIAVRALRTSKGRFDRAIPIRDIDETVSVRPVAGAYYGAPITRLAGGDGSTWLKVNGLGVVLPVGPPEELDCESAAYCELAFLGSRWAMRLVWATETTREGAQK